MKAVMAYAAGIVDGEGCVAIDRYSNKDLPSYCYRLKVRVGNTSIDLIEWLKNTFGGNVKTIKPRSKNNKRAWEWYLAGEPAAKFIKLVRPYLLIKKQQADLAIAFQSEKRGKGYHLTDENRRKEEAAWLSARTMNRRGI
jgi:hypothetical protein